MIVSSLSRKTTASLSALTCANAPLSQESVPMIEVIYSFVEVQTQVHMDEKVY